MYNKSSEQLLIMQSTIESNRKDSDEKLNNLTEDLKAMIASTITSMMDQINISILSPNHNDSPKSQDPTTVVPSNRRPPPLSGGNSTKIGGKWYLKHEIRSPKFYELLIKTEFKGNTFLDLNNFYNHTNMCLN